MYALLLAAVLTATPASPESLSPSEVAPCEAAALLQDDMQTGTLLFSRGDCLAVRIYTMSPYTHVAAVVMEEGQPIVYDSQNGIGVRRLPLEEYFAAQCPDVFHVYQPRQPFSERRAELLAEHLRKELGRPYGVAHHLTGKRAEGLHCAEYATDALMNCRLLHANQPSRVSPASLHEGIVRGDLYVEARTIAVSLPAPIAIEEDASWCVRMWSDTKTCTSDCCRKMRGWFFCQ